MATGTRMTNHMVHVGVYALALDSRVSGVLAVSCGVCRDPGWCVFMQRQVENTDLERNILYSPYTAWRELRHTGLVKTSVTPPVLLIKWLSVAFIAASLLANCRCVLAN